MLANIARLANRVWVAFYTSGLTVPQKCGRRDEVASDVYEQYAFMPVAGDGAPLGWQIASRTVRGIWADIAWRMEAGRDGERVVLGGGSPPLPWLTMIFIAVVLIGCASTTFQASILGDLRVMSAMLSMMGAAAMWLGLHLATHRFVGPVLIALGTLAMAVGLWWTLVLPPAAVGAGVTGVRRAQRLEKLLDGS